MHEQRTANMHKCQCVKSWCIISGCPAGARKWHISYFAMLLHSKKRLYAARPLAPAAGTEGDCTPPNPI